MAQFAPPRWVAPTMGAVGTSPKKPLEAAARLYELLAVVSSQAEGTAAVLARSLSQDSQVAGPRGQEIFQEDLVTPWAGRDRHFIQRRQGLGWLNAFYDHASDGRGSILSICQTLAPVLRHWSVIRGRVQDCNRSLRGLTVRIYRNPKP